ncbi:MAG: HDIG domain-containing protein [Syntrophorhabdaceae bacterium]|nr:HDIG domain-containing protein [Syntrophorhabdaceae bacterium]
MPNGKDKPPSYQKYRILLIFFVLSAALAFVISYKLDIRLPEYHIGDIPNKNIKSRFETNIPSLGITVKKGEVVVREGEKVTEEQLTILNALKERESAEPFRLKNIFSLFILIFLVTFLIYEFSAKNIKKFRLSVKDIIFCSSMSLFIVLLMKIMTLIIENVSGLNDINLIYLVPVFTLGIVLRVALFSEAAIVFSLLTAIYIGFMLDMSMSAFMYILMGNILASYFSERCENRNIIIKAGIFSAFITGFLLVIFHILTGDTFATLPSKIAFIFINGIISSFIALGILPIIEHVFEYTTDIRLLELANLDNLLLEDMMIKAPGTYHHSIIVGNLSKAAAEAIGAHPLLARVAAYYHDIGKLKMPHYFIENRRGFEDAHKDLTPNMSSLIILSHVKEGIELAEKHKLGRKIMDIIREHHGTSLVSYFYNRAKENEDPELFVIDEKDFRYPGPKPQTKEAGIVMLADVVEASSRILNEPTPKRIEKHVQDVIERVFLDGQLDECELTLRDLHAIQKSFITILLGIFHQRIEYPERTTHNGADKKFPKTHEDKHSSAQKIDRKVANLFKATG